MSESTIKTEYGTVNKKRISIAINVPHMLKEIHRTRSTVIEAGIGYINGTDNDNPFQTDYEAARIEYYLDALEKKREILDKYVSKHPVDDRVKQSTDWQLYNTENFDEFIDHYRSMVGGEV